MGYLKAASVPDTMVSILGVLNLALCLFFIQLGSTLADFKCAQDGLYGNPDNCLKFIICAHGQRQDFDCPQGKSWHADRKICDTTDLSKCTATGTGAISGGSEDVFKQHLLSLLADFKPCHAGETTPASGTTVGGTSPNPGPGGNGTATPPSGTTIPRGDGGNPATTPGTAPPGGSSPIPRGTSPNPGQGNGSTAPNSGGSSSEKPGNTTMGPITTPLPPTCSACPIPTEKPCPTVAACPAVPTCPPAPKCDACPIVTEKFCPTAATCQTTKPENTFCDDGWKYFADAKSCYFLGIKTTTSDDAKQECTQQDATLASIHSEAENTFIFNMVSQASTAAYFTAFIGLYRTGPGVTDFANYDGTPVDYRRFAFTQPDNSPPAQPDNRGGNEKCSEMYIRYTASIDSYWNDLPCTMARTAYVCKKAAKNVTQCPVCTTQKPETCPPAPACPAVVSCPTPEPAPKCPDPSTPKTTCPDGWKYFNSTDSCYFVGKEPLNVTEAQKYCRSQGGDLASVHSDAENTFVVNHTLSITPTVPGNLVWIGSYRWGLEPTQFANYDTTPMDYTYWRSVPTQQPDNYLGLQFCTAFYTIEPYYAQWDDDFCFTPRVYVCKKPLNKI